MSYNPNEPRNAEGMWTDSGIAIQQAASDIGIKADKLIEEAKQNGIEMQDVSSKIAEKYNAKITPLNIKLKESIIRKATNDYNGDISLVKDLARTAIVAKADKIDAILNELQANPNVIGIKKQISKTDPLGYSGNLIHYKTKSGMITEIQVNTSEMIYAKEPERYSKSIIGDNEFNRIKNTYKTEGGKGHALYEEYRVLKQTDPKSLKRKSEIESLSKKYYSIFQ